MANRWCDGFGRYGGDKTKMLNGSSSQAWAELSSTLWDLSTANPRTGNHALRLIPDTAPIPIARRVFGAPLEEVFVGLAIRCDALPDQEVAPGESINSDRSGVFIASIRDQANIRQLDFVLGTDGAIAVYSGPGFSGSFFVGTLLGRTVPIIGAGAYQHIEIYARASNENGAVEIRVDEITRLSLTGVNTIPNGGVDFSQLAMGHYGASPNPGAIYFADMYVNDTVNDGSGCHTFIGDCKSGWLPVNTDTAQADFALSAGSDGFALLDDTPPDDATYISTSATTAQSDFGLTNGPANLSEILTVRPAVRAQKDDAGSALIAPSMKSNGVKEAIAGQPITTAFAYYDSNVPLNPDTDAPWTLAELDAALHVVERVE